MRMPNRAIAAIALCVAAIATAFTVGAAEMWESHADFTIDSRHFRDAPVEWFNTYSPEWKSPRMASRVTDATIACFPTIRKADDISDAVSGVKIELIPNSRLIRITATSPNRKIVSAVASNYRKCIEEFYEAQTNDAVDQMRSKATREAEKIKRRIGQIQNQIMKIELQTQLSAKKTSRELKEIELKAAARKVSELESALDDAENIVATLAKIHDTPENFTALPEGVPCGAEIDKRYERYMETKLELLKLRRTDTYAEGHPVILAAKESISTAATNFIDSVKLLLKTSQSNLAMLKLKVENARAKRDNLLSELNALEAEIISAESTPTLALLKCQLDYSIGIYTEALRKIVNARAQVEGYSYTILQLNGGSSSCARKVE